MDILRQVMEQSNTTQSQLAHLSGVKQPSLSQMLHGRIQMSDEMLDRLLGCMGFELQIVRRPAPKQLDRSTKRRWLMHRILAMRLSDDALHEWKPSLRNNLKRLRESNRGEPHVGNIAYWEELIRSQNLAGLRRAMTGLDAHGIAMREVSPFGGLLSEPERQRVLLELRG